MRYVTFNTVNFGTIEVSRLGKTFAGEAFFHKNDYATTIDDNGVFVNHIGIEFTVRYKDNTAVLEVTTSKIIGQEETRD